MGITAAGNATGGSTVGVDEGNLTSSSTRDKYIANETTLVFAEFGLSPSDSFHLPDSENSWKQTEHGRRASGIWRRDKNDDSLLSFQEIAVHLSDPSYGASVRDESRLLVAELLSSADGVKRSDGSVIEPLVRNRQMEDAAQWAITGGVIGALFAPITGFLALGRAVGPLGNCSRPVWVAGIAGFAAPILLGAALLGSMNKNMGIFDKRSQGPLTSRYGK